jgi:hypothetical protein
MVTLTYPYAQNAYRHGWLLWGEFERMDVLTRQISVGRGRDEIIWHGSSSSAVIKTAWVIFKMLLEHEMMHSFQVDAKPLFDPHAEVEQLLSISNLAPATQNSYNLPPAGNDL